MDTRSRAHTYATPEQVPFFPAQELSWLSANTHPSGMHVKGGQLGNGKVMQAPGRTLKKWPNQLLLRAVVVAVLLSWAEPDLRT